MKVRLRRCETLGARLRYLRDFNGLTQVQMGEVIDKSYKSVFNYETNARVPNYEVLGQYSDFSGISVHWLITGDDSYD